jgi:hypothetical protein
LPPTTVGALNEIEESAADTTAGGAGTTTGAIGAGTLGAVVDPPH